LRNSLLSIFIILFWFTTNGQNTNQISIDESKIEALAYSTLNESSEDLRLASNQELIQILEEELNKDNSFNYHFNEVESIGILYSPDSVFRIFNWNIPLDGGQYKYECFIQYQKVNGSIELIQLLDSDVLDEELNSYAGNKDYWYGALYYDIILKESKLQKYYSLLAWEGKDLQINRKMIDVFWFDKSEELHIGANIFHGNMQNIENRIVFNYGQQNKMKLNYDPNNDWIIFDHLSPSSQRLVGMYEYYGADFTHDAYQWNGKNWQILKDVDVEKGVAKKKEYFQVEEDQIVKDTTLYDYK